MTWVTPKRNWTVNDYFNLEDANRISGNLEYLKEQSLEIFPDSTISLLLYRVKLVDDSKRYIAMPIDIRNLSIPYYNRGDTNFADYERNLWYASLVLSTLWINYSLDNYTFKWFSADGPNKAAIDASYDSLPSVWYTGYGVLINDDALPPYEWSAAWYCDYLFRRYYWVKPSNFPFDLVYYSMSTASGIGAYAGLFSSSYPLQNKPFWNASDLNSHEETIANTYRLMTNYGE